MRTYCFLLLFISNSYIYAKEWKSLKEFKTSTNQQNLTSSDWLKSDRVHNTLVWKLANLFNLENNLPQEYINIIQRRDFYKWADSEVENHGQHVVWLKMVHFISSKLFLMETFPSAIFANKKIMNYANDCSESIFNNSFVEINNLFNFKVILNENEALEWDKAMLYKEQYLWVDTYINKIDSSSLKKIQNILKGKFLYSLFVPKKIQFYGDLSNKEMRYNYALNTLRTYCKKI